MSRKQGFTLVELLVVIAIIAILASIVIPKVGDYIGQARAAKALSEIKGADLAVTKMLADADKKSIGSFFTPETWGPVCTAMAATNLEAMCRLYSDVFYELLRQGKAADLTFSVDGTPFTVKWNAGVQQKLAASYMDLGKDPWGTNAYFFYAGPLVLPTVDTPNPFRCYRDNTNADGEIVDGLYLYDATRKAIEDKNMRGNPKEDGGFGYPAPKDLPVYIFSAGANEALDQADLGGGDDINNWDSAQGWSGQY